MWLTESARSLSPASTGQGNARGTGDRFRLRPQSWNLPMASGRPATAGCFKLSGVFRGSGVAHRMCCVRGIRGEAVTA